MKFFENFEKLEIWYLKEFIKLAFKNDAKSQKF